MLLLLLACQGGDDTETPPRSNNAPAVTAVTLSPDPAYITDAITATAETIDLDGDAVTLGYSWTLDGAPLSASTSALAAGTARKGQTVAVEVTISDGLSFGTPLSASIVIQNSAPYLNEVAITPPNPGLGEDLTCTYDGGDADGDALKVNTSWNIDGVGSPETGDVLPDDLPRNTEVWCEVQLDDGEASSPILRSQTVVIGNSPPSAPGITLNPDPPTACTGGEIQVTTASVDPDGDPLSYVFSWIDSTGIEVCNTASCGAGKLSEGATYVASAQAYDGKLYSAAATQSFVAVGGGEQLGNGVDDDCDGEVDEWISLAWQASQMMWSSTTSQELGAALIGGDLTGDGKAEVVAAATGSSSLLVWSGASLLKGSAVMPSPDYTLSSASGVTSMAVGDVDGDGVQDLLVGVPGYDGGAGTDSGAVVLVYGSDLASSSLASVGSWVLEGSTKGLRLGDSVSLGDVDGDGHDDIVLSNPLADAPSREAGAAYLFLTPSGSSVADADLTLEGGVRSGRFGTSVAVVGDIDADGARELVIGAPYVDDGGTDAGAIGLWYGGSIAPGYLSNADLRVDGEGDNALLGAEPASGGDMDGDGLDELLLISQANGATLLPGTLTLFLGSDLAGLSSVALGDGHAKFEPSVDYAALGLYGGGAALSDVDGDGLADLYAGAGGSGFIYLWRSDTALAGGSLTTEDADIQIAAEDAEDRFGRAVALADLDGDGRQDLLASASRSSVKADRGGAVYLLRPPYNEPADPWSPDCEERDGYLTCKVQVTWQDAATACSDLGWTLAEPQTASESSDLAAAVADAYAPGTLRGGFWIGLSDQASEGTWTWASSGTTASATSWETGAPSSDSSRNCATVNSSSQGTWRDTACEEQRFYVCQP